MLSAWVDSEVCEEICTVIAGSDRRSLDALEVLTNMSKCSFLRKALNEELRLSNEANERKLMELVRWMLKEVAKEGPMVAGSCELVGVSNYSKEQILNIINQYGTGLSPKDKERWWTSKEVRIVLAVSHLPGRTIGVRRGRDFVRKFAESLTQALRDFFEDRSEHLREQARQIGLLPKEPEPVSKASAGPLNVSLLAPRIVKVLEFDPLKEIGTLRGEGWPRSLKGMYPDFPLVRLHGSEFPIWAELAGENEWKNLESPLGALSEDAHPSYNRYNICVDRSGGLLPRDYDSAGLDEYLYIQETLHKQNRHNGPAFTFERLRKTPGGWRIDARPGNYFDSVVTTEMLEREFVNAQAKQPNDPITLDALPRRRWLHYMMDALTDSRAAPAVVLDGRFRAAALSVAVTMIFAEPNGTYSALVTRRSQAVQTHPGFYHVAPSGIFAPLDVNWNQWSTEYSVTQTVLREYAEEIFNYQELEENSGSLPSGLRQVPPVRRLLEAVQDGRVAMRYCGISVPLLTLRPEIYVLIFVRDENWFDEQIGLAGYFDSRPPKLNWEYDPQQGRHGTKLDLDENLQPLDPIGVIKPWCMVPHAAAAIYLSTQVARQMVADQNA